MSTTARTRPSKSPTQLSNIPDNASGSGILRPEEFEDAGFLLWDTLGDVSDHLPFLREEKSRLDTELDELKKRLAHEAERATEELLRRIALVDEGIDRMEGCVGRMEASLKRLDSEAKGRFGVSAAQVSELLAHARKA